MVHFIAALLGAVVFVVCVIGFFRSIWRSPGRRGGGVDRTDMVGQTDPGRYAGSHHHGDSGGHGGGGADAGHGGGP